jgi:hypothetical protein
MQSYRFPTFRTRLLYSAHPQLMPPSLQPIPIELVLKIKLTLYCNYAQTFITANLTAHPLLRTWDRATYPLLHIERHLAEKIHSLSKYVQKIK